MTAHNNNCDFRPIIAASLKSSCSADEPLILPLKIAELDAVCGQWAAAASDPCEFEKCLAMTKPFFHLKATRLEPRVGVAVRAQAALFPTAWPAATFNGSFMRPSRVFLARLFNNEKMYERWIFKWYKRERAATRWGRAWARQTTTFAKEIRESKVWKVDVEVEKAN